MKKLMLNLAILALLPSGYVVAASVEGNTCGTNPHSIDCSSPGADCISYWQDGWFSWTTNGKCHNTSAMGIDTGCNCQ